jgi:DNA anti-recombination protein RmuC
VAKTIDVEDLHKQVADLHKQIADLAKGQTALQHTVDNTIAKQSLSHQRLERIEANINPRLDNIEQRFETKLDKVEVNIESRLGNLEYKFQSQMDKAEASTDSKFHNLEQKLETRMDKVEATIGSRLDSFEQRLEAKMETIASRMGDLSNFKAVWASAVKIITWVVTTGLTLLTLMLTYLKYKQP